MKKLKILFFCLLFMLGITAAEGQENISVLVDNIPVWFDVPARIEEGRTLVPVRAVFDALGAEVEWDNGERKVISYKDGTKIILPIGKAQIEINGNVRFLDVAAKIENGRTLVPVRAVSEAFGYDVGWDSRERTVYIDTQKSFSPELIPDFSGEAYDTINSGIPFFSYDMIFSDAFEEYSPLDELGRCHEAFANICPEIMPKEAREAIGMIKPAGWHTVKYDNIDGKYLYNRCHLIGFQLSGENANERNLITGTRYLNTEGMLPFENMTAEYVKKTGNHVLYRVTPVYIGDELLSRGVLMEAYSAEDRGRGICFCVFCHNVQPGIVIDYKTGESYAKDASPAYSQGKVIYPEEETKAPVGDAAYIGNKNSKKFHYPSCSGVSDMKEQNKAALSSREEAIEKGYTPCGICKP